MLLLSALALLASCSSSPNRERVQLMQLARQADLNYQSGKFDVARQQYERLVAANPRFVPGHLRLGALAYRKGDVSSARERFEIATRLDPRNEQAKYNLAMLHLNEASRLLNDYAKLTAKATHRQDVLVLLSHLKEFGEK
ncbi:Tfp pilus assembly protein PilF [Povalibacter uvarum]|uniref:Tfp pilus assembly protein PilF n=2 Tax=Povalibacter uvarum TaxID=732238 RepID=A0A841HLQ2_9GAMM|nr:Tfp pilus assembly protein PilF [Povalibacter uvarum]